MALEAMRKRQIGWAIGGVVLLALVVFAFMPGAIPVETVAVAKGPLEITVDEKGMTRVHDRYVLAAPVSGDLGRIDLREGDRVKAGQVVAQLVPPPLDARQAQEVKSRVAAAEAALSEAQAMAARADASLALAKRDHARLESLSTSGILSPEALDQARTAETSAQRDLEAARSRVHTAESELDVTRAGLLALGGGNVSRVISLKSPIDGEVMSLPERSGRVVAAGQTVMVIGNSRDIELMIEVLSSDAVRIRPGDAIRVEDWGGEKPLEGKVRLVEPSGFTKISALGIEEQRVRVIGDVAGAPAQLGDGFRIEARIVVWRSDAALKVPVSALFRSGESWSVFVIEGSKARKRLIEIGHRGQLEAEVLKGLTAGDRVIVHPGNEVADGVRVGER